MMKCSYNDEVPINYSYFMFTNVLVDDKISHFIIKLFVIHYAPTTDKFIHSRTLQSKNRKDSAMAIISKTMKYSIPT